MFATRETRPERRVLTRVDGDPHEAAILWTCTALALIVRLWFLRYQYVINTDGVYYATLGRHLITGDWKGGLSTYWSPLYPLLVGISSLWISNLELAGRLVSVAAGTALVLVVYRLAREFYGRSAALLAAMLTAVYPMLIRTSTFVMTESVYTLTFTAALLVGWRALTGSRVRHYAATGILIGCCYLLKPEAAGYAPLFAVIFLTPAFAAARTPGQGAPRLERLALNDAVFVAAFLALLLPYCVYLHEQTGQWILSAKVVNNLTQSEVPIELLPDGEGTLLDRLYGGSTAGAATSSFSAPGTGPVWPRRLQWLRHRAGSSYRNLKVETKEMVPELLPYTFILLCLVGLFGTPWTAARAFKEIYLFVFVAGTLLGYAATVIDPRYLLELIPVFLCWTANGTLQFEGWLAGTLAAFRPAPPGSRAPRLALVAIMLGVLMPSLVAFMKTDRWEDLPMEQKQVGLWMRDRAPRAPLIMATGPWAAFYAGGRQIYLPDAPYPTLIDYAKRKRVDYIVVGTRCTPFGCIQDGPLAFLLDQDRTPPDLQLVYADNRRSEDRLLVYALANHAAQEVVTANSRSDR